MKYEFDKDLIISAFRELVEVPSPVGYYREMNPKIEEMAARYGQTVTYDNKSTAYITLEGEDNTNED